MEELNVITKQLSIEQKRAKEPQYFWKLQVTYIFARVAELQDIFDLFAADIRRHDVCLELYLRRYERSLSDSSPLSRVSKKRATFQMGIERITVILDQWNGLTQWNKRYYKHKAGPSWDIE